MIVDYLKKCINYQPPAKKGKMNLEQEISAAIAQEEKDLE